MQTVFCLEVCQNKGKGAFYPVFPKCSRISLHTSLGQSKTETL